MAWPRSKALSWESEAHLRTGWYGSLRVLPALPMPETWGAAAAAAKSRQSCPTLCDPMDCSLPDSSVHGISQARVLEWGAIAFSEVLHQIQTNVLSIIQEYNLLMLIISPRYIKD